MKEKIIRDYVKAYNDKDVEGMIKDLSDDILFENISDGEVNLRLEGKENFKKHALAALSYFTTRNQTIGDFKHSENTTEIEVDYKAVAAIDFPNGLKKGQKIQLKGKSIFEFSENSKIIKLTDIS